MKLFFVNLSIVSLIASSSAFGETFYTVENLKINEASCSKKADGSFTGLVGLRGNLPPENNFAAAVYDEVVLMTVFSLALCQELQEKIGLEGRFILKRALSKDSKINYGLKALIDSPRVRFNEASP